MGWDNRRRLCSQSLSPRPDTQSHAHFLFKDDGELRGCCGFFFPFSLSFSHFSSGCVSEGVFKSVSRFSRYRVSDQFDVVVVVVNFQRSVHDDILVCFSLFLSFFTGEYEALAHDGTLARAVSVGSTLSTRK